MSKFIHSLKGRRIFNKFMLGMLAAIGFFGAIALFNSSVLAHRGDPDSTSIVPPPNTDNNNGNSISYTIAQSCQPYPGCSGYQLEAPKSYFKLYFSRDNNLKVSVQLGPRQNYGPASNVVFTFKSTNKKEGIRGGCNNTNNTVTKTLAQIGFPGGAWSNDFVLDFPDCRPLKSNTTGFYTVQATVEFATNNNDRWHTGRIRAYCSGSGGGLNGVCTGQNKSNRAGFWSQIGSGDAPMALESNIFGSGGYYNIHVGFGTPCGGLPGGDPGWRLKWNDADHVGAGGSPANDGIFWELYGNKPGGGWELIREMSGAIQIGGNGEFRTYDIPNAWRQPKTRFVWVWHHIIHNNDPQLWIPFDSILYDIDCLDFDNRAAILATPGIPNDEVERGRYYTIPARLWNADAGEHDKDVFMRIRNINSERTKGPYTAVHDSPGNKPPINTGYTTGNCGGPASSPPCWFWRYDELPGGAERFGSFSFGVADDQPTWVDSNGNGVADGSDEGAICFRAFAHPHKTDNGEYVGNNKCYKVIAPREPFLTTEHGSVHAGANWDDNPCLVTSQLTGTVRGQARRTGSKADYVVSAGGGISRFGSAGVLGPGFGEVGTSLTFGNFPSTGGYGRICREDIAQNLLNDPAVTNLGQGSSVSVDGNSLPNGARKHTGNLTITGGTVRVGQRSTLVVDGDIYITSNIDFETAGYTLRTIPSLGIFATGNINIAPGVSRMYGIYAAGSALNPSSGLINTCRDGFGPALTPPSITTAAGSIACASQLRVNGALVANRIYFRRTIGDANFVGQPPAEIISYIPQLFLRPPEGAGAITSILRIQNERPPVF